MGRVAMDEGKGNFSMKHGKQIPVVEIEKGHCRTGWKKDANGYTIYLMRAENYAKPGTVQNDLGNAVPVVGVKLWGSAHARIMGMSFLLAAEQMELAEENAAQEDNGIPKYDGLTGRMEEL